MKKVLILCFLFLFIFPPVCFADIYQEKNKFGLIDDGKIITKAEFKKLIRLGDFSYIALKGSKYGIIDNKGNIIQDFKFTHAARILGNFAKLGNYKGFGLYDNTGNEIIFQDKNSIELLFGNMFLVGKNYKYGVFDFSGKQLIDFICDDIYMPKPNVMRIKYKGRWYEIEQISSSTLKLPDDVNKIKGSEEFKITQLISSPVAASKYSIVTTADYSIKLLSSISPAYEATIDELMLSQGAEAFSIFMKIGWIPKFPVVYVKNYFNILRNPQNGPLSDFKNEIKEKL